VHHRKFTAGVNDTGGKLPPVSTTLAANLPPVSTTPAANFAKNSPCVVETGGKFATGVNDTGGKFAAGVNDAGGKLQWWANLDQASKHLEVFRFRDLSPTPIP
jgi:hypothetical protein